jgi:NAD-dependent SIR2 family protein deacetylase
MRARAPAARSTVLFLGAGASAAFGYPTTSAILPGIRDGLNSGDLLSKASNPKREQAKMDRLREHLERLLPAIFDVKIQLPLITDVLSLVDLLISTGETAVPEMSASQLEDFRALLEEAIIEAIDAAPGAPRSDPTLDKLADWILGVADSGPPLTIVSTNYDTLLESVLFEKLQFAPEAEDDAIARAVDFGFSWREHATGKFLEPVHHPPESPRIRIFKLHGSLSWLKCPLCGFIYVNTTGNVVRQAFREDKVDYNNRCVCGHGPVRAVIVAPSMVRSVREPNLLTIWRSALEALRIADEWVVAGYSLPPEDVAIRSILLRAFHGRGKRPAPRIRVVQPCEDKATADRYRLLFRKAKFEYGGFEAFAESLPKPRHWPVF